MTDVPFKERLAAAFFAAALFSVTLVAAGGTLEFARALAAKEPAAAGAYARAIWRYGGIGLFSIPFFLVFEALFGLVVRELAGAARTLALFAAVPVAVGLKVSLDGWLYRPLWEEKALLFCFVAADAAGCAWLWIEALYREEK